MKIIVCQPTRGILFNEVQNSLDYELFINKIFGFPLRTQGLPIIEARNTLVELSLKEDFWTHLLFLDDDVVMPENSLKQLYDLNTDIAIINYPLHIKGYDEENRKEILWGTIVYDKWLKGQSTKDKDVAWGGLGCALIKREVFEKLEKPYFAESNYSFHRLADGSLKLTDENKQINNPEHSGGGEDVYFMLKAKNAGLKIKDLPDVVAKHLCLEMVVPRMATNRYRKSHKISYLNRIDFPMDCANTK